MADAQVKLLLAQMDSAFGEDDWFPPLATAVDGLTAAQAAWRPEGVSNSIWQIVNHVTFWKEVCARSFRGEPRLPGQIDNDATFGPPGDPQDEAGWAAAVQRLHGAQAALLAAVAGMTDAELAQPVPGEKTPRLQNIYGLIGHDAYHGGQIYLLRKQQGSWPAHR